MHSSKSILRNTFSLIAPIVAALALAGTASADTIKTFDAIGTVAGSANTLGGTISIDTTNGTVASAALTFGGKTFNNISRQGGYYYTANLNPIGDSNDEIYLYIAARTLVDYAGGNLCSAANLCNAFGWGIETYANGPSLATGSLVAAAPLTATATPEPSTTALLGGGLMLAGWFTRKRLAK